MSTQRARRITPPVNVTLQPSKTNMAILLSIIVFYCLPWLGQLSGYRVPLLLMALWAASAKPSLLWRAIARNGWFVFLTIPYTLLMLATGWRFGEMELGPFLVGFLLFGAPAVLCEYTLLLRQRSVLLLGTGAAFATLSAGYLWSVIVLRQNPLSSRAISTGLDSAASVGAMGVGDFGLATATPLVALAALYAGLNRELPIWHRTLAVTCLGLGAAFVVMSQFTIALVVLLATVVSYVAWRVTVKVSRIVAVAVVAGLVWVVVARLGTIADELVRLLPLDWATSERLSTLGDFGEIGLGQSGYDLSTRIELIRLSWDAFLGAPIFGQSAQGVPMQIGGHSGWLDVLAQLGLIGGVSLFLFLGVYVSRRLREYQLGDSRTVLLFALAALLFQGLVNPAVYIPEVGFAFLFLVPAVAWVADSPGNERSLSADSLGRSVVRS